MLCRFRGFSDFFWSVNLAGEPVSLFLPGNDEKRERTAGATLKEDLTLARDVSADSSAQAEEHVGPSKRGRKLQWIRGYYSVSYSVISLPAIQGGGHIDM